MTTSSANDPANLPGANLIVELFPRRRLRHTTTALLNALHADGGITGPTRQQIAAAIAVFGDEFIGELERAIASDGHYCAAAIIILGIIASEPARTVLWHVGRERRYGPRLQLDALRTLCQLGEPVNIHELVALANLSESLPPPYGKDPR